MKGRPILGIVGGFLFGLFLAITLFLYGVIPLDSPFVLILPIAGIVLGIVLAAWAPFGRGREARRSTAGHAAAMDGDDEMSDEDTGS
jgi:hypothetical protein